MKTTTIKNSIYTLILCLGILISKNVNAQVSVSININAQPQWGPANYDYVEYYYLPEADVYYYVPTSEYIYFDRGRWVTVSYLPSRFHIDLYRTYKVVINEPRPYMHHDRYRVKYSKYKHSYNKQSPNRDYHGNGNKKGNGSNGNASHHSKGGKGHKGK